jgi:hydrogenase large subunit
VYLPDVCAIGAMYPDWFSYGRGVDNYLAAPDLPLDTKGTQFDLPGGTIMGGNLSTYKPITKFGDDYLKESVTENVSHAWYAGTGTKHPWEGETNPAWSEFDANGKYTWIKAPRFQGKPMQVGPLADLFVGVATKHPLTMKYATIALDTASTIAGTRVTVDMMHSTLGRHVARAIRSCVMSELALRHWGLLAENIGKGDVTSYNKPEFPSGEQRGFGFHEAPRGLLSHWIVIRGGKIENYQAVVPSTWNAGPRDEQQQIGPYEASLIGNPVANAELPLEVLRTVHSFDPCIACAIHTMDVEGQEIARVKAL